MPLVKRLVKGSALTYAEGDGNLTYLDNKVTGSAGLIPVFDTNNTVTGSSNLSFTGSLLTVNGSLTVTGDLTAMQYIISSSVTHFTESFSSGSTRFGDTLNDTHQFTGSVLVTGSVIANSFVGDGSGLTNLPGVSSPAFIATGSITASVDTDNYELFKIVSGSVKHAIIRTDLHNVGLGEYSQNSVTTGYNNTSIGSYTLGILTSGIGNTALGANAMSYNLIGGFNTAIGANTLVYNTGSFNTVVGYNALTNSSSGSYNTILGYNAGLNNLTGSFNVLIGSRAGENETSSNKLYIANSNTSTPLIKGDFSSSILQLNTLGGTSITGSLIVSGSQTLYGALSSSDGAYFTNDITVTHMTIGHGPAQNNTNTAIGWEALPILSTGLNNTMVGAGTGFLLQSGSNNTIFGANALLALTSGSNNVAIGHNAGALASGSGNVFIGHQAGEFQTSGDNKLWISNNGTNTPLIKGDFASGSLQFYTSAGTQVTGSFLVTGSAVYSGSATGVVNSLTISSNTASLDLNRGNFFTLQLVQGTDTYINPSNIKPGQTVNILLNTTGSATVSFPTSVLQASGSAYIPTTTTGKDIITFISYDSTNLYLANVKNFI